MQESNNLQDNQPLPQGAVMRSASDIVKGNRILKFRMVNYGSKRGYEPQWDSYLVLRVTKNKIQVHGSIGTYFPIRNENNEIIKYVCRVD